MSEARSEQLSASRAAAAITRAPPHHAGAEWVGRRGTHDGTLDIHHSVRHLLRRLQRILDLHARRRTHKHCERVTRLHGEGACAARVRAALPAPQQPAPWSRPSCGAAVRISPALGTRTFHSLGAEQRVSDCAPVMSSVRLLGRVLIRAFGYSRLKIFSVRTGAAATHPACTAHAAELWVWMPTSGSHARPRVVG
jgi:hypothetical protein